MWTKAEFLYSAVLCTGTLTTADAVVNAKYYNIARMAGCRTVDKGAEGRVPAAQRGHKR